MPNIYADYSFGEFSVYDEATQSERCLRVTSHMEHATTEGHLVPFLESCVSFGNYDTAVSILSSCPQDQLFKVLSFVKKKGTHQEDADLQVEVEGYLTEAYNDFMASSKDEATSKELLEDWLKRGDSIICIIPRVLVSLQGLISPEALVDAERKFIDIRTCYARSKGSRDFDETWRSYQIARHIDDTSYSSARQIYDMYQDIDAGIFRSAYRRASKVSPRPFLKKFSNVLPEHIMGQPIRSNFKTYLNLHETVRDILSALDTQESPD